MKRSWLNSTFAELLCILLEQKEASYGSAPNTSSNRKHAKLELQIWMGNHSEDKTSEE